MMTEVKINVIFVDDEPKVLDGIRRMLRPMRHEWTMHFANSGQEALNQLESAEFDVIVSDMRMPGMSGSELLNIVQEKYPHMVRIALSGQAEKEQILRAVGSVHQYLSKPCDPERLKSSLVRSCALRNLFKSEEVKSVVSLIKILPSMPDLYTRLIDELSLPDAQIKNVARIISQDVAMSAKVMQLVNSAFFGMPRHVSSPDEAVRLLGLDIIQSLVMTVHVFGQYEGENIYGHPISELLDHSLKVSGCAKLIAKKEKLGSKFMDDVTIAGLLHDLGKLIIASNMKEHCAEIKQLLNQDGMNTTDAERQVLGTSHAEIGGYLLGLWGFPDSVVEAIVFHHEPNVMLHDELTILTVLHVANALVVKAMDNGQNVHYGELDMSYMSTLGLEDKIEAWQPICDEVINQEAG